MSTTYDDEALKPPKGLKPLIFFGFGVLGLVFRV